MIDEYLKKLETIISPQTYDLNNYKDKILQSNIGFPNKSFIQGLEKSHSNVRSEQLEKQENNQADSFHEAAVNDNIQKSSVDIMENTDIDAKVRAKLHNLNVKNMGYRQQIDALNRKIEDQSRVIETQRRTIDEYKVTIENNSRYLLKLESYLVEAGKNKARERFTLNLLGVSYNFAEECKDKDNKASFTVDKDKMKEMIISLINENNKLKAFQQSVFNISKQYDDINEHMLDGLKSIREKLSEALLAGKLENIKSDVLKDVDSNLNKILFCVEETISTKHEEFKLLVLNKEEETVFLTKEIILLNESLEHFKKDRMKDQKILIEVESQNSQLRNEIEELQKTIHENYTKLKLLDTENISSKIEKRIEPCKNTTKHIISKLEKTFDLKDKNNVRFISAINQNLQKKR